MNIVVLSKWNWEPSELKYVEEHLGPIVSSNTYDVVLLDRTPGGYRWYAWPRLVGRKWLVIEEDLEGMVKRVLSHQENSK
jgi:hypothetical protein